MKRALAAAALALLATSGCSGDDATVALPTATPTTPVPSEAASAGASALAGLTSRECASVAAEFGKASAAFSSRDASTSYSERFASVSAAFLAASERIRDAQVKAAMTRIGRIYADAAARLKGVTYVPGSGATPPPAYLDALKAFADPGFRAAATTMSTYFARGCR